MTLLSRMRDRLRHLRFKYATRRAKFVHIHRRRLFGGDESASGPGSSADQTRAVREHLPAVLRELGATSLLDAPCGDFAWMKLVELGVERYVGADIVPELVAANQRLHGRAGREFVCRDLASDPLPRVDLVFCRDCLVHLSNDDVGRVLRNVARSGSRFLLTTTFPSVEVNREIITGQWRPLNLERPPFSLPPPLRLLEEGCTEEAGKYSDKALGLWPMEAIARLA